MASIIEKACTGCGLTKTILDFPPDRRARDGKQSKCRLCINAWMKDYYRRDPVWSMLRRARARSQKEGFEFNLTVADLTPLPSVCPIFKVPLRLSEVAQDPNAYSIDRIDNARGYVRGNIAVMSYRANRLKNDGSAEDHEAIAAWMRSQSARVAA